MSNRGKQEIIILPFQSGSLYSACGPFLPKFFIEFCHNVGFFGWPYVGSLDVHCSATDNCISGKAFYFVLFTFCN